MRMTRWVFLVLVLTVAARAESGGDVQQSSKFGLNLQAAMVLPTGDNDSDWAGTMEFKGLYWLQPRFGVGLSFGFGSWWAEEDGIQPPFALPALEDEESSVTLSTLPIGASVYFRPIVQPKFALNLEAGIRYVAIWDDVTVLLDGETPTGDDVSIQIEHDGDADGGWIAVLGADLELNIASNVFLGFGVGYQFDLTDQDYTLWDGQPRDLSFDGIGLRGTFGVRF